MHILYQPFQRFRTHKYWHLTGWQDFWTADHLFPFDALAQPIISLMYYCFIGKIKYFYSFQGRTGKVSVIDNCQYRLDINMKEIIMDELLYEFEYL